MFKSDNIKCQICGNTTYNYGFGYCSMNCFLLSPAGKKELQTNGAIFNFSSKDYGTQFNIIPPKFADVKDAEERTLCRHQWAMSVIIGNDLPHDKITIIADKTTPDKYCLDLWKSGGYNIIMI